MSGLLGQYAYVALVGLIISETFVVRYALRETLWFKRFLIGSRKRRRLPTGTPAPDFSARILGQSSSVDTSQFQGYQTMLLFVTPDDALSPYYEHLTAVIHALWHKVQGHLYLICRGNDKSCERLVREHTVAGLSLHSYTALIDADGQIMEKFLIDWTPQAVLLDSDTRISKYGRPEGHEIDPSLEAMRPGGL
jgi:hypothetical protein